MHTHCPYTHTPPSKQAYYTFRHVGGFHTPPLVIVRAPGLLYVALSRLTHLEALALHPIRVTETGQIEDLPFYKVERFTKVNTSNKSAVIMAHLRWLLERALQQTD